MSKAVLISIRPKWCELIASGKKTIEVRKTRPKIKTPIKCYVYCTKDAPLIYCRPSQQIGNGKVIGEFMCDEISRYALVGIRRERTCYRSSNGLTFSDGINYQAIGLTESELREYGDGKAIFGWHISGLKIYDQPRKMSEFRRACTESLYCEGCAMWSEQRGCGNAALQITRPPQSWCYVEELT